MEKDFLFVSKVKPATPEMPWQATLKDPKTEEKRIFRDAPNSARHLENLADIEGSSLKGENTMKLSAINLILSIFLALLLAACGVSGSPQPPEAEPLECETQGYPCTWSEVPKEITHRTKTLAVEAAAKLKAGEAMNDVAAWLQSQSDLADIQGEEDALRFRLAGGRAVWVVNDPVEGTPSNSLQATPLSEMPHFVANSGKPRSALVLAPLFYESSSLFREVNDVANTLNNTRGFGGRVETIVNDTASSNKAGVGDFASFHSYDVIYVATHGTTVCQDLKTGTPTTCRGYIAAESYDANDFEDVIESTTKGVDLVEYVSGKSGLGVGADFFHFQYPGGLSNKLLFLSACKSAATSDLTEALMGKQKTSSVLGWTKNVTGLQASRSARLFFQGLARGLTVGETLEGMGTDIYDALTRAELVESNPNLRIRDLITVSDGFTGKPLSDTSGIEITLAPDDGEDDKLLLEIIVDGIEGAKLEQYFINLSVNGKAIGSTSVSANGEKMGEHSYRIRGEAPLGFDARAGQTLNLRFWMPLPEGGSSEFIASPKVTTPVKSEVAEEWLMTSTTTVRGVGSMTTRVTTATWVAEPGQDASSRYRYFKVKSGTMNVTSQSDVAGCTFNYTGTVEIGEGEPNTSLKIDTGSSPMLYEGLAIAKDKQVEMMGVCEDGETLTLTAEIGGIYFMTDAEMPFSGDSFGGAFNDGAALPTIIEWTFTKVQ
jgi:hypothetical protein